VTASNLQQERRTSQVSRERRSHVVRNGRSPPDPRGIEEDGTGLLVRFNVGVLPGLERERLYQFVSAIANSDAVLSGRSRYIYFFDPTGERVGSVSPLSGIKLTK